MSQGTLSLTFTHHLHKLFSLTIFFMDRSILARSHFIDVSYKTETLVNHQHEQSMFIPICHSVSCCAFYSDMQFAGAASCHHKLISIFS